MSLAWQHRVGVVPSTLYQVMKFPTPDGKGIMELHGDQTKAVKDYCTVTGSSGVLPLQKKVLEEKPESSTTRAIVSKEINIGTTENDNGCFHS